MQISHLAKRERYKYKWMRLEKKEEELKEETELRMSPAGLFAFYSRCQFCQFASGSLPCGAGNDASRLLGLLTFLSRMLTFLSRMLTFRSLQLGV